MKRVLIYLFLLSVCYTATAQVKIGGNAAVIDPASILELESSGKALYLTRVSLTSTTDVTTVPNPKAGMMVYNTNTAITGTTAHPIAMNAVAVYYYDGTAWVSTGCCAGNAWLLTGNAGTVDGTNFLGTTDNVPFNLRVNNIKSGRIESDINTGNVSYGYQSQLLNTPGTSGPGDFNTSVGNYTLQVNTTGGRNSAFGYDALGANTTGDSNTAVGYGALQVNTTGFNNTATGAYALNHNTTGKFNVADGYEALHKNITDSGETSVGAYALYNNNGGRLNVATGLGVLFSNLTGSYNNGVGASALRSNYSGSNNAAFGTNAGYQNNNPLLGAGSNGNNNTFIGNGADTANVSGNNITALGYRAGYTNNGSNNTFLGASTAATSNNLTYAAAIGAGATICVSNGLTLGAVDAGMSTVISTNVGIDVCDPTQRIDFRNGHIRNRQDNLPAFSLPTASGITGVNIAAGSSDVRGTINTTGFNNGATYTAVTVTFQYTCTNAPVVTLTPANQAASTTSYYVASTTNSFTIFYRATTPVQTSGVAPSFNYQVIE